MIVQKSLIARKCFMGVGLDVSKFDTRNSISFESMFEGCSKLKEIDVSCFNSSKCEKICCMFSGCRSINRINMLRWDMSKIRVNDDSKKDKKDLHEGIYKLFYKCQNLTEITMNLNFIDIKKLYTYQAFEYISDKGAFTYKEENEHFLNLLPKKWTKKKKIYGIVDLFNMYSQGIS